MKATWACSNSSYFALFKEITQSSLFILWPIGGHNRQSVHGDLESKGSPGLLLALTQKSSNED